VRARWGEGNHHGATVDPQGSCLPEGSVLRLKGTPAKQQLLISIVVIFVTIAVAYFALVSPR
jgi:hypothetical protein